MNQFGNDETWVRQQIEAAEPLQNAARTLGSDLLAAATSFKTQGKELPGELLARYVQWEEQFSTLRQEWEAQTSLSQYFPDERDWQSLSGWMATFSRYLEEVERRRAEITADREEKLRVIDSVLALTCKGGPQNGLKDAQLLAESLKLQLLDESDRWEDALQAPEHQSIRNLWELILDSREGRVDAPESLTRSEQVAKQFGVHVAMQAYAGRYVSSEN